ncbi:MAG: ABC transporter permease [Polyangiales bacterium]
MSGAEAERVEVDERGGRARGSGTARAAGPLAFLARRLGWAAVILFLVVTATFLLDRVVPSDPARMVAGPQARAADVARLRQQLGLDRPLAVQYGLFLRRIVHLGPATFAPEASADHASCGHLGPLHLDLGRSYQQRKPVVAILRKRLPYTVALALAATVLSVVLGVGSGLRAALRRNRWLDATTVGVALIGISAPTFVLGVVLQYLFAYELGVLPLNGAGEGLVDGLRHLILPAATLGIFGAAFYTRLVRGELIELFKADWIRTARAKGVPPWRLVIVHALRNAWAPIVTAIGLDLGALLGGAVITEQLFGWPGLGSLAVRAMRDRDGPVIVGTVLVGAIAIVLASLVVDVSYTLLDPRVRRR